MDYLLSLMPIEIGAWAENFKEVFITSFIEDDRYKLFLKGMVLTLRLTLVAAVFGIIIGVIIALMRISRTKSGSKTVFSYIAGAYIDIIRGTPSVVQLLILYLIVFATTSLSKSTIAIIAFSINSSAYVAEIVRAGIQAVDYGQTEAGRSLGLSRRATMQHIVMPQAFKNILPALINEFIVLLKETAIVGYIGAIDITKASDIISSRTFKPMMPLLATAAIYFILVKILTILLGKLERRLHQSDSR